MTILILVALVLVVVVVSLLLVMIVSLRDFISASVEASRQREVANRRKALRQSRWSRRLTRDGAWKLKGVLWHWKGQLNGYCGAEYGRRRIVDFLNARAEWGPKHKVRPGFRVDQKPLSRWRGRVASHVSQPWLPASAEFV